MGKPKGKNAFFHFMIHTQNELKREGINYSINDNRLQKLAGDKWRDMPPEEREPFEAKSRGSKEPSRQKIAVSPLTYAERASNSLVRILSEEDVEVDEEFGRAEYLVKMVESCVNACKTVENLLEASFFIMASNVMIRTDDRQYPPLEIAIVQYTIRKGIVLDYKTFVDPGPIPLGYARMAKEFADDFHKIPLHNFYPATNDYTKIVKDMEEILDKSRFTNEVTNQPTPMIVFCRDEQVEQTRGVFEWLARKYRAAHPSSGFEWNVEILDLVNLLYYITSFIDQHISLAIGEERLNSSAFDYSMNTNCDFHDEQENRHCATGVAKRYCYMLSDTLCPLFKITPTDKHLPPTRASVTETYYPMLSDVKPMRSNRFADMGAASSSGSRSQSSASEQTPQSRPQSTNEVYHNIGIGRGRGVRRPTGDSGSDNWSRANPPRR